MFRVVKKNIKIWIICFCLNIKSQMQYKSNFILNCTVMFITYFCEFVSTWFLINNFSSIGNWSTNDILLVYSIATLSYGLSRFFFNGFNNVSKQLKRGDFYIHLIKPFNEILSIVSQNISLERIGQIVLGLGILVISLNKNHNIQKILLIFFIINGTIIYSSLFIISAAVSFWVIESKEIMGIMTHGTLRAIVYPLSIYKKYLRDFMTYIVPVAFISYYPSIILLKKSMDKKILIITWLVGILVFMFSIFLWKFGIKKYEGSGG